MNEIVLESSAKALVDLNEKISVLHVDDDSGLLEIAKQCLELDATVQVDTAVSVEEAFKKLEQKKFDVIISDYQMPVKDGLEFLKELREKGNMIPFIIFTGKGREEVAIKALNLGANQYLDKVGDAHTVYTELAHSIVELTKTRRNEEARERAEKKYKELADQLPVIVYEIDMNGKFSFVNEKAFEITGYSHKDFEKGLDIHQMVVVEDLTKLKTRIQEALRQEKIGYSEYNVLRKDGSTFPAIACANAAVSDGEIVGLRGIVLDNTERKKTEQELSRFSAAVKTSPDGIITGDLNGNIDYANEAALRMYGCANKHDLIGKNAQDLLVERDRARALQNALDTIKTRQGKTEEYTALTKNGEIPIEVTTQLIIDEKGLPTGFVDIVRDLTERKRVEHELGDSEEKFRAISNSASDAIILAKDDGQVSYWNPTAERMFGYKNEEAIGKQFYELVVPERFRIDVQSMFMNAEKLGLSPHAGRKIEAFAIKRDGSEFSVELSISGLHIRGEWHALCLARDITNRKRVDDEKNTLLHDLGERVKELRCLYGISKLVERSEFSLDELLQRTVELLPSAWQYPDIACARIVIGNQEFKTVNFSESSWRQRANFKIGKEETGFVEVLYFEERPAAGEGPFLKEERDLINAVAERLGRIIERVRTQRALKENEDKFEALFRGNPEAAVYLDSDFCTVDINPRFEELFGYPLSEIRGKQIDKVIAPENMIEEANMLNDKALKGFAYCDTIRMRKDGSLVPVSVSAAPIFIQGELVGYVSVYKNISNLKKTESDLAIMNEKLRVVGALTRHDVRNKLSVVAGYSYLIKKEHAKELDTTQRIDKMTESIKEIERIFEFAKIYEQLGAEELIPVNVGEAVSEATALFSAVSIKIVNDCQGLRVVADSSLRQLFYNFIDNTQKYGLKATKARIYYEDINDDKIRLIYEDDGVGISNEDKSKLFKEGYSTGGSTGFGLFLIKKMMDVYGWQIQETGEPGKGVKFIMTLPKLDTTRRESPKIA